MGPVGGDGDPAQPGEAGTRGADVSRGAPGRPRRPHARRQAQGAALPDGCNCGTVCTSGAGLGVERQGPDRDRVVRVQSLPPQAKVHRSQRIWSMYVDLVEALGTFDEAREVYDRMIDNKVASAQAILNYADFLQQQKFWEDAFQVYEKGIANFRYPHVERIWKAYLTAFVDRHKGNKVERTRDLFIQVRRPMSLPATAVGVPGLSLARVS